MDSNQCRWGMLGTAGIARKNWQAIRLSGNGTLIAVASRNFERSRSFVETCQAQVPFEVQPEAVEGYEKLIARDDINAVYIPLPTGIRKEWVIRCAKAGKHVMCEKPCALNAADLKTMIGACQNNGVQFMDGVMFMHTDRLQELRKCLDTEIGTIKRIHSQLTFESDQEFRNNNIRTNEDLEPHGCLGDLGWYNIRIALWALNWQLPYKVRATAISKLHHSESATGIPMSFSAELFFEDEVTVSFYCGFESHHQQFVTFSGTSGYVEVPDFVLPYSGRDLAFELHKAEFQIEDCYFEMRKNSQTFTTLESGNNAVDAQETKLFRQFSSIVNAGKINDGWPTMALLTQTVLDACFESANQNEEISINQ